ncbi:hypothetical protein CNYM01_02071 [Colletotrichum nymphaeae SA-01]|uniref:Uncharacterized protein n=1 Tax=Colletotrichum nymphaeae SA-01 TaxID=1460502 RepID=A0A135UWR9_9PEZI|nr:hypothetical protein CNYM01_02071 [Colletotrichum nymphaeae SA-01]
MARDYRRFPSSLPDFDTVSYKFWCNSQVQGVRIRHCECHRWNGCDFVVDDTKDILTYTNVELSAKESRQWDNGVTRRTTKAQDAHRLKVPEKKVYAGEEDIV